MATKPIPLPSPASCSSRRKSVEVAALSSCDRFRTASGRSHRRQQDRVLDAKQTGQCGLDNRHLRSLMCYGRSLH
jgi:hypothetical protein